MPPTPNHSPSKLLSLNNKFSEKKKAVENTHSVPPPPTGKKKYIYIALENNPPSNHNRSATVLFIRVIFSSEVELCDERRQGISVAGTVNPGSTQVRGKTQISVGPNTTTLDHL